MEFKKLLLVLLVFFCFFVQSFKKRLQNRRYKYKEKRVKDNPQNELNSYNNHSSPVQAFDNKSLQWQPNSNINDQSISKLTDELLEKCLERKHCIRKGVETKYDIIESMNRNCFCDDLCVAYDDCCADFVRPRNIVLKMDPTLISCSPLNVNFTSPSSDAQHHHVNFEKMPIRIIKKCPRAFKDSFIKSQCAKSFDWFRKLPVNGRFSKIVYQNYYCAVCNGDTEVVFWNIEMKFTANFQSLFGIGYIENMSKDTLANFYKFEYPHNMAPRYCEPDLISKCADWWKSSMDHHLCTAHDKTSYIYADLRDKLQVYRNGQCAICNGIASDLFSECPGKEREKLNLYTSNFINNYKNPSFRILIDINTNEGFIKKMYSNGAEDMLKKISLTKCEIGSVLEPFEWKCKEVFCKKNYFLTKNGCKTPNDFTSQNFNNTSNLTKTSTTKKLINAQNKKNSSLGMKKNEINSAKNQKLDEISENLFELKNTEFFLNCSQKKSYNDTQVEFLEKGSIKVTQSGEVFSLDRYQHLGSNVVVCHSEDIEVLDAIKLQQNESSTTLVDIPSKEISELYVEINYFNLTSVQRFLSFVAAFISIFCIFITLICFIIFKPLRTSYTGFCIVGLATCLTFVEILIIFIMIFEDSLTIKSYCFYIAISLHFFSLSSFFWLNSFTYMSFKNHIKQKSETICEINFIDIAFLLAYTIFVPSIIVCATAFFDIYEVNGYFRPHYAQEGCWISNYNAILVYFFVPAILLVILNFIFIFFSAINHCKNRLSNSSSETFDFNGISIPLKINLIVISTWITSSVAAFTQILTFWFLFIFLNCLIGPVMFFSTVYAQSNLCFKRKLHENGLRNEDNMVVLTTDSFISKDESSETSNGAYTGKSSRGSTLESRRHNSESQEVFEQQYSSQQVYRYHTMNLNSSPYTNHLHVDNRSLRSNQGHDALFSMRGRYTIDKTNLKELVLIETCM